ncbi:MAG: hypothetical protein EPO21_21930 [Chloroflexota bacterium]|nr:MAG: hypothetical protein EPO21_21930 [Chloroflexota bacterium]
MREREQQRDEYWQLDEAIDDGSIRLRIHYEEERYSGNEIVSLKQKRGVRTYYHARPYLLIPRITLTLGLHPEPKEHEIGKVLDSQWEGMDHREIGNAQAYWYPADKLLLIWECLIFGRNRPEDPSQDERLANVWQHFEHFLLKRHRQVTRIGTPAWEPEYPEDSLWQQFLRARGYRPLNERAFVKEVAIV